MFEKFLELIKDDVDPSDADLLRDWYQKDENALPPVYLLQSINSKLRHYDDEEREDLQREARNRWWNISNVMRSSLQKAAQKAVTMEIYSQEEVQMFFSSGESFVSYCVCADISLVLIFVTQESRYLLPIIEEN